MTTLELKLTLPDEIARRAQNAGLLTFHGRPESPSTMLPPWATRLGTL